MVKCHELIRTFFASCEGHLVASVSGLSHTGECLEACKKDKSCGYASYFFDGHSTGGWNSFCLLTSNCDTVGRSDRSSVASAQCNMSAAAAGAIFVL